MLTLVWSSEQSVKDEVVENFTSMYFTKLTEDGKKTVAQQPQIVAINLVALTSGASLAVITSLDEIIGTVTRSGAIEPSVIKALWELVGLPLQATVRLHPFLAHRLFLYASFHVLRLQKEAGVHEKHMVIARGALSVLAMVAKANPEIISSPAGLSRLREVLTHSFDLRLARHACVALQAYAAMDGASEAKSKLMDEMLGYVIQMIRGCVTLVLAGAVAFEVAHKKRWLRTDSRKLSRWVFSSC